MKMFKPVVYTSDFIKQTAASADGKTERLTVQTTSPGSIKHLN
jgi:hypothetical protein